LKTFSNWPTFPHIFAGGEIVGGCDIISSMAGKGELAEVALICWMFKYVLQSFLLLHLRASFTGKGEYLL
jgi:hypothetical protein